MPVLWRKTRRLILERVNEGQFKSKVVYLVYQDYALTKEQLLALREAADAHFGQFTARPKNDYPTLTKGDIDYCCLYLLRITDREGVTPSTKLVVE